MLGLVFRWEDGWISNQFYEFKMSDVRVGKVV